ncbi:ribosome biogenesis GTPase Der [Agrobacterium vitis]|uniref:GTPase Der n=2 Tax=Rhizobium/Agrobacterium group TaxID=227290 RepID=DER_ALLAM|nr:MULTISPECIES: ribosome biogenesis GTPase Der [Rhizobium/Agrobacterium group]B9JZQ5.1 RecName: Full=GTPase Der; AltName: Full=GTP-binding protein EngA [Allorhizobium ampelinum S4]MCF1498433.1 ribosome biogenesis GTPase Der [Allorhizobium sp. Av2]ACM37365.1 GTP-binding protein [Allorhizobium ampelinum S4]KAA3511785.1 ribosome biogenesis GTPase Der [Agrobacterium vitis]KAA3525422.1 ribosome biogenesis GTPase Der [Agrobacterium vitis]MCF1433567.1 ribosome biogenesis GTPase Der [Allorhizobium a
MSFTVAIVGRPNVGKSTLFNRLVGKKLALVDDTPGVTRDRRPGEAKLVDLRFHIVDTAGLEEAGADTLEGRMRAQTEIAIDEADLSLFVVDAKMGLTHVDKALADMLRKRGKPVVLVANKSEARGSDGGFYDAFTLGLGEPVPISAEHGQGMIDLRDAIVEAIGVDRAFPEDDDDVAETDIVLRPTVEGEDDEEDLAYDDTKPLRVAIVGRPNAGKSTLINRFLGEDRLLTGPEAGITRDSISVEWDWRGRTIKMFDTAGMRRKARVIEKLEKLSVADTLRAIRFAETVVIVFDATIPFEKQDIQIVDLVLREGRAAVLAFNKWDLVEDPQAVLAELREKTERLLPQARGIRAVPMAGQTGYGLEKLMQSIIDTDMVWNKRISTAKLNRWLDSVQTQHPPPAVSGRRLKLKYMTQVKARPPAFMISCTRPDSVPESYIRYLTNGLRADFNMPGVPIRIHLKASENPFENKRKRR